MSRGGIKLAHALDHFGWDVTGRGGARRRLARPAASPTCCCSAARRRCSRSTSAPTSSPGRLRQDPRVVVHEQTNARYLTDAIVTEPVDIIVCDASFIGLAKVLDTALGFAKPGGRLIALIKPQFEAERQRDRQGRRGARSRRCTSGSAPRSAAWLASAGLARSRA